MTKEKKKKKKKIQRLKKKKIVYPKMCEIGRFLRRLAYFSDHFLLTGWYTYLIFVVAFFFFFFHKNKK